MPNIKYQRPEPNYITKTSTSRANRFQEEAQDQNPLKASDLDQEFNALVDNDNDISERMAQIAAGVFPDFFDSLPLYSEELSNRDDAFQMSLGKYRMPQNFRFNSNEFFIKILGNTKSGKIIINKLELYGK